ncbi:hypothetical protein F2Q68_00009543 [Brassica cretica]|uniref:Uncharacterized protein n=1 Tax=Brassica cretica TaxID=69181 RepID=A0A8S9KSS2_BRACR|nr:hypothetical protein F2Q68_00009543 [Brassica cretica]
MERWSKSRERRERADFKRENGGHKAWRKGNIFLFLLDNPKLFLLAFRLANSDQAQLRSSSTPIKLSFRSSLSVINVLSLSSAYVQLRPNPRPDATVREKKQARDSSRQRDKIGAVPRPFVSARL